MPMATIQSRAYCLRPGLTPSWTSAEPPVAPDELPLLPVLAPTSADGLDPPVEDVDEDELDAVVAESQRERWEAMLDRAVAAMHQEPAFDAAAAIDLALWEAAMADPAGAVAATLAEDTAVDAAHLPVSPPLSPPDEISEVSTPAVSPAALEVVEVIDDLTASVPGELVSCAIFVVMGHFFLGFHDHHTHTDRVYLLVHRSQFGLDHLLLALHRAMDQYACYV